MTGPVPRTYASTPMAIIDAAERLFGRHGIEAVSTRQIMLEAKVGNKSAVAYHFGTRVELVRAIWQNRLPTLEARRRIMMDQIREQGLERDVHEVIKVLILPNYELIDAGGRRQYAAFFRHALRWREGVAVRHRELASTPTSQEATTMLETLLPHVPKTLLHQRMRYATCAFFDMVFDRDCDLAEGRPVAQEKAFLAEGVDMIAAACDRPVVEA